MPPIWRFLKSRRKRYGSFTGAELDREYSPSSRVDDIQPYLDRYAKLSEEARRRSHAHSAFFGDLSYGLGDRQRLDLFMPRGTATGALMVYVHGGFWQMLSKSESSFAAPVFQDRGCHFVAPGYTLAPAASLAEIVEEIRQAIVWLYRHAREFGYDDNRIYLAGSSAGAHLACMMLLTDWPGIGLPRDTIKGVCAVSGVYDLEPIRLSYVNKPLMLTEHDVATLSPARHMLTNHAPVILALGDNETAEFKRQTNEFYEHLVRGGEEVQSREIIGRNHFDVILDLCDDQSWLARATLEMMGLVEPEPPWPS